METVLSVTTPIYLIIGAGFAAVRWRWMAQPDLRVLGRFVAQICVPALLFNAISHQSLGAVLNADYLAVYAGGSLIAFAAVTLASRRWGRRPTAYAALQGLGASGSNSGFVGYPIVLAALGPIAAVALALGMLVENLVVMPLSLALADSASLGQRRGDALRAVAAGWLRNPMIIAIAAGLVVSALGLPLPVVIARSVELVAAAAPPTA
jgi:predicted permease